MSWLNEIMGSNPISDKDIASSLLMSSKFDIHSLAMAATESTNPQFRDLLGKHLNSCLADHYRLSDMAVNKDWYKAYASPQQQLKNDYKETERTF